MNRIAKMLADWRPHRDRWLAAARHAVTGQRHAHHGLSAKAVCSALSAPIACIVAGAALASVATSDQVDDAWTRVTAQSFVPVDMKDIDPDQFYVRQVGISQLDLEAQIASSFTSNPGKLHEELTCLAQNIYFEARSEPLEGKLAVAHVVMNRVASRYYPDTVCGVVQDGTDEVLHRCQFSWYCDGKSDRPREWQSWREAMLIAGDLLTRPGADPTGGALYFHSTSIASAWHSRRPRAARIGGHVFYH